MNIQLPDRDATIRLGTLVADCIDQRAVIALIGPLGAGKTTFVQGLARGLGITEIVNSPTFTMLNEYHSGRLPLYHLDLYRLGEDAASAADLLAVELDEVLSTNMVAVLEWAELFNLQISGTEGVKESYLSQLDHLVLSLTYDDSYTKECGRKADITDSGVQAARLKQAVRERLGGLFIYS